MPSPLLVALAFLGGLMFSVQSVINANVGQRLGDPIWAAALSFVIGLISLLAVQAVRREAVPSVFGTLPWQAWTPGLLGAAYVSIVVVATPRLSAAVVIGLAIAGQLIGSLALDHLGALGLAQHPLSVWRLLGAALLLVGVVLIRLG